MADQDAQDINQMMSATVDVVTSQQPKKSRFLWIVLGCVIVGVGLGIVVYQQSVKTVPVVKTTPKPTPKVAVVPSPLAPVVNFVTAEANTMVFPQTGKLRVFTDINNISLVIKITTAGQTQTLTIPNKKIDATTPLTYVDSTFEVVAGSTATIISTLNAGGPQNLGWILPTTDNLCGANQGTKISITPQITWAQSKLVSGQTIFAKQCWADPGSKTVIEDNDFNDFVLLWSYATTTAASSASPGASAISSASPGASVASSASPNAAASNSPLSSGSVTASVSPSATATTRPSSSSSSVSGTTIVVTPTPTSRAAMPDTTDGVPVTGVFEVTVGTVSVGLILLLLGLFGLLAL